MNQFIEDNLMFYDRGDETGMGTLYSLSYEETYFKSILDSNGKPLTKPQEKQIGFIWNEQTRT